MALPSTFLHTAKSCKRVFHDVEYTIRLTTDDNGLTVEAEVGGTGEAWRSQFTQCFIEEISRRAGNAKSFPVFLKMLVSALDEDSSAVHIDILTARDLDMLRQRQDMKPPNTKENSNKRYLILTYQAEFDKVHYPLALQPVEIESKESLRTLIHQLRLQLDRSVKSEQTEYLTRENEELRAECEQLRLDLEASQQQLADAERYNSGGADIRRESAELRHAKQSLSKHQNELKTIREAKQRLVVDHRKELEQLRRELGEGKNEIRRLQAQVRRGDSAQRGISPVARGISPGVRSFRSRPLSASSASSASDCSNPSSLNRPPSSRYNRARGNALPTVPSHRVSPNTSAQRRNSPSNSYNSFRPNPSPRRSADLPPRRQSPMDRDRRNSPAMERGVSPPARDGRPSSLTRRGAPELSRQLPGSQPRPPPSRRHSPTPSYGSGDRGKRQTSRSLSPSMKGYVSPYAQPSRLSPQRRGSGNNSNSSYHYEDRSPGFLPKPSSSQRAQSPVQRHTSREREREPERRGMGASSSGYGGYGGNDVVEAADGRGVERGREVEIKTSPRRGETRERGELNKPPTLGVDSSPEQAAHTSLSNNNNQPLPASPVRMRAGPDIAPVVTDIDARLTALQNFLRHNQTVDA